LHKNGRLGDLFGVAAKALSDSANSKAGTVNNGERENGRILRERVVS